jgi:adenylate cyclase
MGGRVTPSIRPRRLAAKVTMVAGAAALAIAVLAPLASAQRAAVIDGFQPSASGVNDVVIVALDATFTTRSEQDAFGAFAPLVGQLSAAGASAIVLEPDVIKLAQAGLAVFGEGLSQAQFQAGLQALEVAVTASVVGDLERVAGGPPRLARPVPRSGVATSSIATGFATPIPLDAHEPQRTVPLVARAPGSADDGVVVPSLSLAGVLAAGDPAGPGEVRREGDRLVVGDHRVLVEEDGRVRVRFARELLPDGARVVSGSALADGDVDPSVLQGQLVFVGVTDPLHAQLFPAAAGTTGQLPVVYVDANAANTILTGSFTTAPSTRDGVLAGVALGAVLGLMVLLVPLWVSPFLITLVVVGLWVLERSRVGDGAPFDLVLAWGGVLAAAAVAVVWRIVEVARARRRTAALFARYVPDTVAQRLLDDDVDAARSTRTEVATFFCDVRGFTPLAATLQPDEVQRLLDLFYEHVAGAILDIGGTVMQFVGDEVFAIFGAPLPTTGPAEALGVTQSLLRDRDLLRRALYDAGLPDVHFGIGLHVGPVVAAHVGTARRLQYSAVGDTVNIGSRLCGQAEADTAVLSEEFWIASGRPPAATLGPLSLKGVHREVRGYRLSPAFADVG